MVDGERAQDATGAAEAAAAPPPQAPVAAVLTAYNRRDLTLECLRSVRRQSGGHRVDVYLVDDGSSDGTADAVRAEFPDVAVLAGDGNLFWNGGMRLAFGAALQRDYDFYWWLNDDTHLDEDALDRLLRTHGQLAAQGRDAVIVVGCTRDPASGKVSYGGLRRHSRLRPTNFKRIPPADEPRPCETMNGNCVLIDRAVTRRVGNLDPVYIQQMGDIDYGLRARRAGCTLWMAPGTIGTCAPNPPRRYNQQPLSYEFRRLLTPKRLPPRPWRQFTRRWAGPLWPVYFVLPYIRLSARLIADRLPERRRPAAASGRGHGP